MEPERKLVTFAVDETKASAPGEIAAVAVVRVDDPPVVETELPRLFERLRRHPTFREIASFSGSHRVGFHFQEDIPDVQQLVLTTLQGMPFEAYLAFTANGPSDSGYAWYDRLLRLILPDRLAEVRHRDALVVVEAHDRLSGAPRVEAVIDECVQRSRRDARYPHSGRVVVCRGGKSNPLLAIPDYVLGAFRRFWQKGCPGEEVLDTRLYRMIEPRVRLIVDADSGERLHRGNQPGA
jgi:hypothetical protein